jgi:lysyl-tRNA synthetase class 2
MSEADIRAERLKKSDLLKEAGMDAYPAESARDTSVADFFGNFEEGKPATLAGRIMSLRGQGGIMFADIFDGTGRGQVVLQAENTAQIELFEKTADTGDFLEFTGTGFKTQRGKESLKVLSWKMLAKSLVPIPTEHFGVKDEELRLRERYLDILLNPETRAMFERRSKFWKVIRDFYLARGFMEVETPILENMPGGADAPQRTQYRCVYAHLSRRALAEAVARRRIPQGL